MNATAALSAPDFGHPRLPRSVGSHTPVALEDWEAEQWSQAAQRLREFWSLQRDWDGAGAEAPAPDALLATAKYLQNLYYAEGSVPPTALSPTPLGTLVLEWRICDDYLEAEIAGANEIVWMKRDPDGSYRIL